jgi:hypothetical protein
MINIFAAAFVQHLAAHVDIKSKAAKKTYHTTKHVTA